MMIPAPILLFSSFTHYKFENLSELDVLAVKTKAQLILKKATELRKEAIAVAGFSNLRIWEVEL